VETQTILRVERQIVQGQEYEVLVGVRRQAWVRRVGSNELSPFIDFEVRVDPLTRVVTPVREVVLRPPLAEP
jgi:hypothetical protein